MRRYTIIALLGVSIASVGTVFASNNNLLDMVDLGIGQAAITSPIGSASIGFNVTTVKLMDEQGQFSRDVINACTYHSPDRLSKGSTIICKLTDLAEQGKKFGDPVAAGLVTLDHNYQPSTVEFIPITRTAFPFANDVQDIHDVKLIVLGPEPSVVYDPSAVGANVDFEIEIKLVDPTSDKPSSRDEYFVTVVKECSFDFNRNLKPGSQVFCSLTDKDDKVIAEGSLNFPDGYTARTVVHIPINDAIKADVQLVKDVKVRISTPAAGFLIIDEDGIDNGLPPNFFSDINVNDQKAEIGVRDVLKFFKDNVGLEIVLHTGEVGDEGWFGPEFIPQSWIDAGPTDNGLTNYFRAGPGLGSPDAEGNRESLLDKIPKVIPLRAKNLASLVGGQFCALVYDSNISINYDLPPLGVNGNLKGANLGIAAFEVLKVEQLPEFSSSSLPKLTIRILDASEVCVPPFQLRDFEDPTTSSIPVDIIP